MRLVPDSMAGRVAFALIGGVILILGIAVAVATSGLLGDPPRVRRAEAASQILSVIDTIRRLPPTLRADAAREYADAGFEAEWHPPDERPPRPVAGDDSHLMEWSLRRLGNVGRPRNWEFGSLPPEAQGLSGRSDADVLYGRIRLRDGSWVTIRTERDWHHSTHLIRLLVILGIVAVGLAALAFWLARWMTAPLGRFAVAAETLGADVRSPPMREAGPVEIRTAAHAFNEMQRRIRRFIDERMHMVAAASHDLRTPITRLKLRAEFIDDEELRAKIVKDLDEMEAVIASTIQLAREETSHEPLQNLDLAGLLQEIVGEMIEAGSRVGMSPFAPIPVQGRPVALKRAFANLVRNAVTYGAEAKIELKRCGPSAIVRIDDLGPGIPMEEREKVFAPFYTREPSRSRRTGGTGLGLSIARAVIRTHGGEIELADAPGGAGLRQIVTLPIAAAPLPRD